MAELGSTQTLEDMRGIQLRDEDCVAQDLEGWGPDSRRMLDLRCKIANGPRSASPPGDSCPAALRANTKADLGRRKADCGIRIADCGIEADN